MRIRDFFIASPKPIIQVLCWFLSIACCQVASAAGTAANTVISNTAIVDYQIGGSPTTATATAAFGVEELLDVNVLWQDAANVAVLSPSVAQIQTFLVTNTGNGVEQFLLTADALVAGDNFDPVPTSIQIWLDANGSGVFEAANDTLYNGTNGPILDGGTPGADSITVFVLADIPSAQTVGNIANVGLTAISVLANGAGLVGNVGAEIVGAGDGGIDANIGVSGADDNAIGIFEVVTTGVAITKSVVINDTQGGTDPHPGASLQYSLSVAIAGSNTVENLVITDVIPANTTYVPNSIILNGVAQTDANDAPATDFSDFAISAPNTITVDLSQAGAVSLVAPANFTILFTVTID